MSEIRTTKIDGQEFVTYKDYKELKEWYENLIRANKKQSEHIDELEEENKKLEENRSIEIKTCNRYREKCDKLKEEKQELEYLGDINQELKEENKKLKYVIDLVMEKAGIEYIRLADGDVFTNPKNKLHISDTIQIDILNHKQ